MTFSIASWTIATFLGWLLGIVLIIVFSALFEISGISNLQFYTGLGVGAGVGFAQWRKLKTVNGMNRRWLWYCAAGFALPFFVADLLHLSGLFKMETHRLAICAVLGSLCVSLLTFSLLKTNYKNPGLWIPVSVTAWLLAAVSVLAVEYTRALNVSKLMQFFINLFLILAGGIVLGFVSGLVLKKMIVDKQLATGNKNNASFTPSIPVKKSK